MGAQKNTHRKRGMCETGVRTLTVSIATWDTSNGSCSEVLASSIIDWLFCSEGGASFDRVAILSIAFFPIQNTSDTSWIFYNLLCKR